MPKPFLTIITCCCRRPKLIAQNIASVKALTDWDIEQIFIPDPKHRGLLWANRQYAANVHRVDGRYVLLLDDDVILVEPNIVQKLKAVPGRPGIIMVKAHRPQMRPNILPRVWGNREALRTVTVTNGRCFAPSAAVWKRHAKHYGLKAAGDYGFINSVSRDASCTFYWLDVVVSKSLQLGRSKVEADCPPNWFRAVCAQHGLQEVAPGDWRLPLYRMGKSKPKRARAAKRKKLAPKKPVRKPAIRKPARKAAKRRTKKLAKMVPPEAQSPLPDQLSPAPLPSERTGHVLSGRRSAK